MSCGGGHLGFPIGIKNTHLVEDLPMIIPGQFGFNHESIWLFARQISCFLLDTHSVTLIDKSGNKRFAKCSYFHNFFIWIVFTILYPYINKQLNFSAIKKHYLITIIIILYHRWRPDQYWMYWTIGYYYYRTRGTCRKQHVKSRYISANISYLQSIKLFKSISVYGYG